MSSYTFAEIGVEAGEMQMSSVSHSSGLGTIGQDEEARVKPSSADEHVDQDIIFVKYFCTIVRSREDTCATSKIYIECNLLRYEKYKECWLLPEDSSDYRPLWN